jgi:hypothetical protein
MTFSRFFTGILLWGFLVATVLVTTVSAAEPPTPRVVVLPKDEIVNRDYFNSGNSVTLSGVVNGDAYIAGGKVTVEGTVNGDVLAAGGIVTIRGKVTQNVRIIGGQVLISGEVDKNVTVAGGNITVADNAKLGGSLVAAGGTLTIDAPVAKGVTIAGGQVTFGSRINGSVTAYIGQLELSPSAIINGDLTYWSRQPAVISPGATIIGIVIRHEAATVNRPPVSVGRISAALMGLIIGTRLVSLVSTLIVGFLLLWLMPVYVKRTVDTLLARPAGSFGVGFLSVAIFPLVVIILALTLAGIPLAILLVITLLVMIYLAKIFLALVIGRKTAEIFNWKLTDGWIYILGFLLIFFISFIPVIGGLVIFIGILFGLGAIVLEEKDFYLTLRQKKLI